MEMVNMAMDSTKTHHEEPGTIPYRYTYGEAFENIAQPTPRPFYAVSSPSPLLSSSHIFSETGSVLNTSTVGSRISEPSADTNLAHDFARHGDYCRGRESVPPSRRYEGLAINKPPDSPSKPALSQFIYPRDMVDQHPRTDSEVHPFVHPVMFTDDAGLKLCDRLRRLCFNCKATTTTTWRRSTLNPGKLVCNKCGLFERTHAAPRPKSFPRRRRSPPARSFLRSNLELPPFSHPAHREHCHHPSVISSTGQISGAFGSMGSGSNSQDTTGRTDNVFLTPCPGQTYGVSSQPSIHHLGFHPSSTVPAETGSCFPSHHGISRHWHQKPWKTTGSNSTLAHERRGYPM